MLRMFVELQQRMWSLRERAAAADGVTVPEYMLVLGFISIVVVVAFQNANVSNAITAMSSNLASKINP